MENGSEPIYSVMPKGVEHEFDRPSADEHAKADILRDAERR